MRAWPFLLLLLLCSPGRLAADTGADTTVTQPADCPEVLLSDGERVPCFFADSWIFSAGGWSYVIATDGSIRRNRDGAEQSAALPMDNPQLFVEGALFAPYGDDVIVVYGLTDGEGAAGRVARLGGDPLTVRWSLLVNGFNLSQGLLHGQFMYQAAIGLVGKIDLTTGKYVWKHEGLYGHIRKGAFNAFETPVRDGGDVLFVETTQTRNPTPLTIRVNDATGAMQVE